MKISPATKKSSRGLTLIEALVVVAIFLAVFCGLVSVVMHKQTIHDDRIRCLNNLKQVGLSANIWAQDNGNKFPDKFPWELAQTNGGTAEFTSGPNVWRHFQVLSNELSTPRILVCPADKSRVAATNFTAFNNSNISYFLNLDATGTNSDYLLSGDRNIANGTAIENGILQLTPNHVVGWDRGMHQQYNNLLRADGRVQESSTNGLRTVIAQSAPTNHLLMPVLGP